MTAATAVPGQMDLLTVLTGAELGEDLAAEAQRTIRAEFARRTAAPEGVRCWLCGDVEPDEDALQLEHGLRPLARCLAARECTVLRKRAQAYIVRGSQDRGSLAPDERAWLRQHLRVTGADERLLALTEAPPTAAIDRVIDRCIYAWHVEEVARESDRKARTKLINSIGRYYAEGQGSGTHEGGWLARGKKGIAVSDPGVNYYEQGQFRPQVHRVAQGESDPYDGMRLYSWRELLERAVELRAVGEPQPAEEPRRVCDCRGDHDFHPRHVDCMGDPRISRVRPWGRDDEAARQRRQGVL